MNYKISTLLLLTLFGAMATNAQEKPPNVLFIMIDDLRPELATFGSKHAISPNINELAQQGTKFTRAYVSVPVCGASRASMFTSMRPLPDRFKTYNSSVDKDAPNAVTIFQQFKDHGYQTTAYGKIFHKTQDTAARSWTDGKAWVAKMDQKPSLKTGFRDYQSPANIEEFQRTKKGPSTEMLDLPDDAYFDGKVTNKAIEKLTTLAKSKQPFFLALGFVKPHLPFTAPKKYWDLYDPQQFKIPENTLPKDAPINAYHTFVELRGYSDTPPQPQPVGDEQARRLIHGYHAAVSYADAQVGKVLATLDSLNLSDNTIVVLMGDYGYALGEHGLWCKHSTFDLATRTPLIIRAPEIKGNQVVNGLVEFIDIFPTLTELARIQTPEQMAGTSLVPLLKDPSLPAKSAVFPRYHAAEAIRTERYSLTKWFNKKGGVDAQMLFDHQNDPSELLNVANVPGYQHILVDLGTQLENHMETRK
jgi:iduronate 2-sulfatase